LQRAGFAGGRIVECHGSLHHLQCTRPCSDAIWPADALQPEVDSATCLLRSPLPTCPHCGALARPNVLMFNDGTWIDARTEAQYARMDSWRARVSRLAVIELGAATDVPSVRWMCERQGAPLIRINPRDPEVEHGQAVGIAAGALDALCGLRDQLA